VRQLRIVYDGREYAAPPGRSADTIRREIADAVGGGRSIWLAVLHGERRAVPTTLLVGPGTQIAVIDAVPDDAEPRSEVHDTSVDSPFSG
jgi:hypothetical protein